MLVYLTFSMWKDTSSSFRVLESSWSYATGNSVYVLQLRNINPEGSLVSQFD